MRKYVLFFLVSFPLAAFSQFWRIETAQVTVNDPETTHKFHVVNQDVRVKVNNQFIYHWFRSNAIHHTQGGFDGKLLHGEYSAFYLNYQLREKGQFKKGHKKGEWKSWHENGKLRELIQYKKGLKHGQYRAFNKDGELLYEATYQYGVLHGLEKHYKKGELVDTKEYEEGKELPAGFIKKKKWKLFEKKPKPQPLPQEIPEEEAPEEQSDKEVKEEEKEKEEKEPAGKKRERKKSSSGSESNGEGG